MDYDRHPRPRMPSLTVVCCLLVSIRRCCMDYDRHPRLGMPSFTVVCCLLVSRRAQLNMEFM
jgi:hypothetical protein